MFTPLSRPSHLTIVLALSLTGSVLSWLGGAAQAATEIRASLGPIQASIPFTSLETYVQDDIIDNDLAPYIRYIPPDQLAELRSVLTTPIELNVEPLPFSHILYSDPGEMLLRQVGNIIRTRQNNGQLALRAALLLAITDKDEGFTPLNVIRHFPADSLVIDFETGLGIARDVQQAINQSTEAIALIKQQFQADLAANPPTPQPSQWNQTPAIHYEWDVVSEGIPLENRAFPVDVYLPARETPAPIVVISHGLGSNRDSYQYLADHLAASGFAVVVPEHEGSNAKHIQALLEGDAAQVADPTEFINRAQDISLILTELSKQANTNPALIGRLDIDQIGVIGQSFGGYTAFALGGATLNLEHLREICPTPEDIETEIDRSLNLSLLLQCRALDLGIEHDRSEPFSLRDERVDAIIAINPIGSAIFGQQGMQNIDIPVMIMTGSADIIAPTLWEQLHPFSWLQTPEKFFITMHKGTHFSTIGSSAEDIPLPPAILGPVPKIAQSYVQDISLPFFQTYLSAPPEATIESLTPAYISQLSRTRMPLSMIQDFDTEAID